MAKKPVRNASPSRRGRTSSAQSPRGSYRSFGSSMPMPCDGEGIPVEVLSSCETPVFTEVCGVVDVNIVSSDVQDFHYEKSGYVCDPATNTWVCTLYTWIDGEQQPDQVIDSGISCEEDPPTDIELKEIQTCVDNTLQVQFCQITFIGGVAQEPVLVGDPIDTGIECNIADKATTPFCTATNKLWVDNHSIADRPPGIAMYPQRDYHVTLIFSDGSVCEFDHPATGQGTWAANNDQLAASIAACTGKPWVREVRAADGDLTTPYGSHAAVDCCPGDPVVVQATARRIVNGEIVQEFPLAFGVIEGEEELIFLCSGCGETATWQDIDGNEITTPACFFIKGERPEVPEPIAPLCSVSDPIPVCVATYVEDADLFVETVLVDTGVFLNFITCNGETTTEAYTLDADGNPIVYELDPNNFYADCETLEPIEAPAPECPENAVWQAMQVGGHYFIWDNSNYDGLPVNHLQNGNNYEFTVSMDDGTSIVIQQTADPYFNNFMVEIASALGCKVLPVCANHTSPKGCNVNHVANLAMYPAYDTPTAPGDIQNNLNNPTQDELWATGWLVDCGDCLARPVSVEITNANDATHIGATKNFIVHDKEIELVYQAVTCDGIFYKDCEGNDIPAPACCPEPYAAATELNLDQFKTTCPTGLQSVTYTNSDNATEMTVSVGGNGDIKIDAGGGDDSDAEITAFITDCLAAGQEVELSWTTNDTENNTGTATLLPDVQTNAFPNFYNDSVNASGASGKVQTMTASHAASEECALRVSVCPEPPAPVVSYDYEFECVDGQLAVITTTTTDGVTVTGAPVPIDPAVDCTNADDFELVTLCAADGFVHIYAYDKSDLSTVVADVTTSEACDRCQPFDIVDYWKLEGGVPGVNGSRWRENAAPHGPVDTMFDGCGNHINGDADEVIVSLNWNVTDADFPATGSDFGVSQEYYYSWVYFPQGVVLEDNNGNTGEFINAYVGGKDQKPVFQKGVANTSSTNRDLGTIGSYPAGLYKVAVELSDFSVFGGVNLRWSLDGGNTFVAIPQANIYSEPPVIKCVKVRVNCDGTKETLDGLPFVVDPATCSECEIKCPVIEDTTTPPDYEFQTVLGCDDVDGDPDNFINVTQETLIVDGVKTVTFYTDYGTDTQAEYTLQGLFVDCATGVPIEEPPIVVDCKDWEVLTVYDAIGTNGVNVERWNTNAITGEPVTAVPSDVFTGAPDYSGMPAHDNGVPDGPIIVENDLLVLDQVNDQSQMRGWTYLYTPEPIRLREFHPRAEAVDYFLGECCAPPSKVATGNYPNNDVNNVAFDVSLPAGIHYVGFEVFDFSAYSSVDYQYSTDNGVTWTRVPAAWLYTAKPRVTACQMKVCPETGLIADIRTGVLNTTASLCEPELCGPVLRTDAQCAYQTFYHINYPEIGTVEQQWIASAVNVGGATGSTYLDGFTETDNEGYPSHENAPDSTISSTITSTTNVTSGGGERDQAQSDFYIFLTEPTELREFNSTAEASGIWISETCGSSKMVEILNAPYLNQFANALDTYGPGCYRVRLYHSDFSANGVTRLQGRTAGGAWANLTPYLSKPSVSVVKGWACDDGNFYTLDKTETLDPTEYLCEDPRCAPSNCCPASSSGEASELQSFQRVP